MELQVCSFFASLVENWSLHLMQAALLCLELDDSRLRCSLSRCLCSLCVLSLLSRCLSLLENVFSENLFFEESGETFDLGEKTFFMSLEGTLRLSPEEIFVMVTELEVD